MFIIQNQYNDKRIKIVSGHYGTGKTEFVVNLALKLAEENKKVAVADMDVVNPFFRSRECHELFKEKKIEILGFSLSGDAMDMPALSGNIVKPLTDKEYEYVIDLGGDYTGSLAMSSFREKLNVNECDLYYVVNANRPETCDLESAYTYLKDIERILEIKVTKIVNNTHMVHETTVEDIMKGNKLAKALSEKINAPVRYTVCTKKIMSLLTEKQIAEIEGEIFPIDIIMRKSWM